ncbi:hypothetical protein VTI28DRAFT_2161 [Corynascus sepedonium]
MLCNHRQSGVFIPEYRTQPMSIPSCLISLHSLHLSNREDELEYGFMLSFFLPFLVLPLPTVQTISAPRFFPPDFEGMR